MTGRAFCRKPLRAPGSPELGSWVLERSNRRGQDKSRKVRTVGSMRNRAKFRLAPHIANTRCNLHFATTRCPHSSFHTLGEVMSGNDDFRVRPGRIRSTRGPRTKSFLAQALQAAQKAGGVSRGCSSHGSGFGRGRAASLAASRLLQARSRNAMVKARVVRQMRSPGRATSPYRISQA